MHNPLKLLDPLRLASQFWPRKKMFSKQVDICYSMLENDETEVPAANKMGKDWIAAFIALWFWISAVKMGQTCRILTTSVAEHHLKVLWGEIGRFIADSEVPLLKQRGGPFVVNYQELRRANEMDSKNAINYLVGRVSAKGEGMAGHHADLTLCIGDEASGIDDEVREQVDGWAKRKLWIGNCNPCVTRFMKNVKAGDLRSSDNSHYHRKIIRITCEDSPNVQLARRQQSLGLTPTDDAFFPGVLTWGELQLRRMTWDKVRQAVGLEGVFWEGAELLLFPPEWLNKAEEVAAKLSRERVRRQAKAMGVDTGEGGDDTAWCVIDELGIIELIAKKTPDTNVIPGETLALIRKHGVNPTNVVFDLGGGGKQAMDRLRAQGFPVRGVAFGGHPSLEIKRGLHVLADRKEIQEDRYVYTNLRAEMYHEASMLFDPTGNSIAGFGLPAEYDELRRQLCPMPKLTDEEGRLRMLPKNKRSSTSREQTLVELIGNSPDEADAFVLAVHGMLHKKTVTRAGAIG